MWVSFLPPLPSEQSGSRIFLFLCSVTGVKKQPEKKALKITSGEGSEVSKGIMSWRKCSGVKQWYNAFPWELFSIPLIRWNCDLLTTFLVDGWSASIVLVAQYTMFDIMHFLPAVVPREKSRTGKKRKENTLALWLQTWWQKSRPAAMGLERHRSSKREADGHCLWTLQVKCHFILRLGPLKIRIVTSVPLWISDPIFMCCHTKSTESLRKINK